MCLINLKSKKEVAEYRRRQPKEFYVWKVMQPLGRTQYSDGCREPLLGSPGKIYKAEKYSENRSPLTYKPGFHAFRTKKQAQLYERNVISANSFGLISAHIFGLILVKFKARPVWIKEIGEASGVPCLVLSHIKILKGG